MKRIFAVILLCASLLLSACTASENTAETTGGQTSGTVSAPDTESDTVTESGTETDAAETKGVTGTETEPETETDKQTGTDKQTETEKQTETDATSDTDAGVTVTTAPVTTKPHTEPAETTTDRQTEEVTTRAPETETTAAETTAAEVTTTAAPPKPVKTSAPEIKGWVLTEPDAAMIYGECEPDSELHVKTGQQEYKARSDGGYFVVYAFFEGGEELVEISAVSSGKTESDLASVTVKNNKNAEYTGVTVTLGSRVIEKKVLPDQYGTNKFSVSEQNSVTETAKYRLEKAAEKAGKPVKLVYVIVPDPLTVHNEEMTAQMKERVYSPNLRMKQAVKALSGIDGITVIDLTETLKKNKENGKLYYKLDSHWTELGAFYGYTEVMSRLGVKAHKLSDYRVDYIDIDDTDMNVYSGVGTGKMYESAPFLTALFEEKTPYGANKDETARIWSFGNKYFIGQTSKTKTDANDLTALFLYDSYGFNIIPYLAESFGTFVTQPTWKYNVDYSLVTEYKPDYIIELLAERDLDELLSAA